MSIETLVVRIKRQEGPWERAAYRLARALLTFELPTPRLVYRALYYFHTSALAFAWWVAAVLYFRPMFRSRCASVGKNLTVHGGLPYVYGDLRITLGDDVTMSAHTSLVATKVYDAPQLNVGHRSYIGFGVVISAGREVTIGDRVHLADRVFICDNPGHPIDAKRRAEHQPVDRDQVRPVRIEDDVWVGTGAIILPGVHVGRGAVVGAGAVVTRDVAAGTVVAGNPARPVRTLTEANEP